MNSPTKLTSLIDSLTQANGRLKEALVLDPTRIHKDATIQRFEFTIELSWKTMQEAVKFMGNEAASPRDAIRVCARINLVESPEQWIDMLKARNLTSHLYQEQVADDVYTEAHKLPALVADLLTRIEQKLSN